MMLKIINLMLTNYYGIYAATVTKSKDEAVSLIPTSYPYKSSRITNYFNFCRNLKGFLNTLENLRDSLKSHFVENDNSLKLFLSNPDDENFQLFKGKFDYLLNENCFNHLISDILFLHDDIKKKIKKLNFDKEGQVMLDTSNPNKLLFQPMNGFCPVKLFVLILSKASQFESSNDFTKFINLYLNKMIFWNFDSESTGNYSNFKDKFVSNLVDPEDLSEKIKNMLVQDGELVDKYKKIESWKKIYSKAVNLKKSFITLAGNRLASMFDQFYEKIETFFRYLDLVSIFVKSSRKRNSFGDDNILIGQLRYLLFQLDFDLDEITTILKVFDSFLSALDTKRNQFLIKFNEQLLDFGKYVQCLNNVSPMNNGFLKSVNYSCYECTFQITELHYSFLNLSKNQEIEKSKKATGHEKDTFN